MRRKRSFILAALAGLLLLGGVWLYRHVRSYETSRIAAASWTAGGSPYVARVTVVNADGSPVVGAYVDIDNNSGGNGATTDANGLALVELGEPEVLNLDVNGQRVVNRPLAGVLGTPSVSKGLVVRVTLRVRA